MPSRARLVLAIGFFTPTRVTHVRQQVISTARTCNLILIVLDCLKPLTHKRLIEHELEVSPGEGAA